MSISTGDSRNSTPKKSTTPAAAGGSKPEAAPDEPVGGVLPVKKAARAAGGGRTGSGGKAANGAGRTASGGGDAAKSGDNGGGASSTATTTATKTAAAKSTTKSTPAKTTSAATKTSASSKTTGGKPKVQSALVGGKAGSRPAGKGGGRRPVTPVRVAQSRNWGPILLYSAAGLAALAIIAIGAWPVISERFKPTWQEQAAGIPGLINYIDPESPNFTRAVVDGTGPSSHKPGDLTYEMTPPAGGFHNVRWQNCMGDVYTAQIADEHAVHSLEHGAVWVTYRPDLPQDQIDKLAEKVSGRDYLMMSPHPDLDTPISLQAWGYQLKVDNADDGRIDDFINALRLNATQESGAICSSGITETSPTPIEF